MAEGTDKSKADIYVGVALEIQKQEIVLAPKTPVNKINEQGLELELPSYTYLGKVGTGLDSLIKDFTPENTAPIKVDDLNTGFPAIDGMIKMVKEAHITLGKFHLKIHPEAKSGTKKKPNEYTVAMLANWPSQTVPEKVGGFNIKGLFLMVTNEQVAGDVDAGKAIEEAAAKIQKSFTPKQLPPAQLAKTGEVAAQATDSASPSS